MTRTEKKLLKQQKIAEKKALKELKKNPAKVATKTETPAQNNNIKIIL